MPTYSKSAFDLAERAKDAMYYRWSFMLYPTSWQSLPTPLTFNWTKVKFDEPFIGSVPDDKVGVYSFVLEPGIASHPSCSYLLYVGMTDKQSFRQRYRQYLKEPSKPKPRPRIVRMLTSYPNQLYFCYSALPNGVDIEQVESQLIEAYWPPVNSRLPAGVSDIDRMIF